MFGLDAVSSFFGAVYSLLQLLATREQIKLKRLVLDEQEKLQDESDQLETEIQKLRAAHSPDADARADRLRERVTARALLLADFTAGLSVPEIGSSNPNQTGVVQAANGTEVGVRSQVADAGAPKPGSGNGN